MLDVNLLDEIIQVSFSGGVCVYNTVESCVIQCPWNLFIECYKLSYYRRRVNEFHIVPIFLFINCMFLPHP